MVLLHFKICTSILICNYKLYCNLIASVYFMGVLTLCASIASFTIFIQIILYSFTPYFSWNYRGRETVLCIYHVYRKKYKEILTKRLSQNIKHETSKAEIAEIVTHQPTVNRKSIDTIIMYSWRCAREMCILTLLQY